MTNLQKQIELLELKGTNAELLSLLTCRLDARIRHRAVADQFRLQAVELRHKACAV
jgi:hypothetical protein